jgi:hypothetical protein
MRRPRPQHFDRIAAIEQHGVGRKIELFVVAANQIQPKSTLTGPNLLHVLARGPKHLPTRP